MDDIKIEKIEGEPDERGRQRITASWNTFDLLTGKHKRDSRTFFTKVTEFIEKIKNDKTLVWTNKDD